MAKRMGETGEPWGMPVLTSVLSLLSIGDQPDFPFAHEALCLPDEVVLYL